MLAGIAEQAEGADLIEFGDDRALVGAVLDVLLELLERRQRRQRGASALALGHGEVNEAHAVVQLEGGVSEAGGLGAAELVVDGADELLVLLDALGLDPIANHDLSHLDDLLVS
jgi:hypothetical protein